MFYACKLNYIDRFSSLSKRSGKASEWLEIVIILIWNLVILAGRYRSTFMRKGQIFSVAFLRLRLLLPAFVQVHSPFNVMFVWIKCVTRSTWNLQFSSQSCHQLQCIKQVSEREKKKEANLHCLLPFYIYSCGEGSHKPSRPDMARFWCKVSYKYQHLFFWCKWKYKISLKIHNIKWLWVVFDCRNKDYPSTHHNYLCHLIYLYNESVFI